MKRNTNFSIGWPSMGIRFSPKANASYYLDLLEKAAEASNGKFDVFTHSTMPERYHFAHNERIAPIYIVPRLGYALTNHIENGSGMSKGVSLLIFSGTIETMFLTFYRTTDTTTKIPLCTPCSSPTGLSPLLSSLSTNPARKRIFSLADYSIPTKDGTPPPTIPMSWIHSRMLRFTTL